VDAGVGEVDQERLHPADDETAGVAGAPPGRVRALLAVGLLAVVGRPGRAAVGRVRARDAGGLHHAFHGVAPAEATGGAATAHMAPALVLEPVTARRAQYMPHVTLHAGRKGSSTFAQDPINYLGN